MRRAAFILCLCCVSALDPPVTLRAAADTASRSGVALTKTEAAVSLPQAARNTPPRSATLPNPPSPERQTSDPHPFITEFIGPAPATKAKPAAAPAPGAPRAQLHPTAK